MANLTYRVNSAPTLPGSSTVKNSPLTNAEVDANFKAIDVELAAKATPADITSAIASKQNTLVSGTTIKTVNSISILGSGDIEVISGLKLTAVKTANYTAVVNDLVRTNSTTSAFNITLPDTPADGDKVGIFDVANTCNTNNVTVLPAGGKTIEGNPTSLVINTNGAYVALTYNSFNTNWKILATPLTSTVNLKTVNNTSLIGTGNVSIDVKTVNGNTMLGTGNVSIDVKTVNGNTMLGTGNVTIAPLLIPVIVSTTTVTAVALNHYFLSNVAATTITLPASPAAGDAVAITPINSLSTNVINRNGNTIMGLTENLTLDNMYATILLRYINNDWKIV